MADKMYRALVVRETSDKTFKKEIEEISLELLPPGDVLIRVMYSSLNYKDMLSSYGNRGVTKKYPHTPGIDSAGIVEESSSPDFKPGDEVIVTSYDLGMNTSGGLGEYIRVPSSWIVKKPHGISLKECMIFGTAGFTAALSILRLTEYGIKGGVDVLVTGGSGGVGSIAISIFRHIGFHVTAVNGLNDESAFLKEIGASEIISISDFIDTEGKPLLKERWAACVDTVGGDLLTTAIRSIMANGAVTCCGNAASPDIPLTVYPFILRGVALFGIDSQNCPMPTRSRAWNMISNEWKFPWLESLSTEVSLSDVIPEIDKIKNGKHRGRTIVNLQ